MRYLLPFFLLVVMTSCKKTDIEQSPEFPSTLFLNGITKKSKIRLYSDRKEITNSAVIASFVKNSGRFTLEENLFSSDEYITFLASDSAKMSSSFNSLIVIKNGDQVLFKSTDRIITTKKNIEDNFNMAKYRSEVEPVWDSKFSTYRMLVGYGNFSELKLSTFEYSRVSWHTNFTDFFGFSNNTDLYKSTSSGNMFNEFDESFVNSVGKYDTLAIQEYFYSFKRR